MAFPLIAAALGLAEFAPVIARWMSGEHAENVAHQVIEIAKRVTNQPDSTEASKALAENSLLIAYNGPRKLDSKTGINEI